MKLIHIAGSTASLSKKGGAYVPPVNATPVAGDDAVNADLNVAITIAVLSNDTDADGDTLIVTAINGTPIAVNETRSITGGTVTRNSNNTLAFTGTSVGSTVFAYTAEDGHGGSDTATVTVTVTDPDAEGVTSMVPLTLQAGPVFSKVPVRNGIPLPIGQVYNESQFRLDTNSDVEVAAQFESIANWEDGSIKAVLVSTVQDISASPQTFKLHSGPTVSRTTPATVAAVVQAGGNTTITTGVLTAIINNKGLFTSLMRGATETLAAPQDVFMVKAADSLRYALSNAVDATVTVEEDGPMCVQVVSKGHLRNGTTDYLQVIYRRRFHAGSDIIEHEITYRDDRPELSTPNNPLTTYVVSALEVGMELNYALGTAPAGRFALQAANTTQAFTTAAAHYQHTRGEWNYVDGANTGDTLYSTIDGTPVADYSPGVVALDGTAGHLSVAIRDFWQMYPGELHVDGPANKLTLKFFSGRGISSPDLVNPSTTWVLGNNTYKQGNLFHFNRQGSQRTYRFRTAHTAATLTDTQLHSFVGQLNRNEIELSPSLAALRATKVFGELNDGGSTAASTGMEAWVVQAMIDPSWTLAVPGSISGTRGLAVPKGWLNFGDRIRPGWAVITPGQVGGTTDAANRGVRVPSFYNGAHLGGERFMRCYMRTGEKKYLPIIMQEYRHFMDLGVRHSPRSGYWATGGNNQPAGELHQKDHEVIDHNCRNTHAGHWHASMLPDAWLLLGDRGARDALEEIAGWHAFMAPYSYALPYQSYINGVQGTYKEAERDYGWPLFVMNEWVRVTGDHTYHANTAGHLITWLMQWWQTPRAHIGYNAATGVSSNTSHETCNAANGNGYWIMDRMDNYGAYNLANGCNPWMASAILTQVIKWYDAELRFVAAGHAATVNHATLREMLYQCMNFVVKHGWVNDTIGFAYSETVRTYGEGWNQLIYSLLRLHEMWTIDNAAGTLTNPAWHDTQSTWTTRAATRLNWWRAKLAVSDSQSSGSYGYEFVTPPDAWTVAARLGV